MEDLQSQIWKVEVSRSQRRWGLLFFLLWLGLAVMKIPSDWTRDRLDADSWTMALFSVLSGLFIWGRMVEFNAMVLRVERGVLKVDTQLRPAFLGPHLSIPIPEVALEWVDGRLMLQWPQSGRGLLLSAAPQAKALADWLVARGARSPVGGYHCLGVPRCGHTPGPPRPLAAKPLEG